MEILDATLREGAQRANQSYTIEQKTSAAKKLDELGIDIIQVGFPVAEDGTAATIDQITSINAKTSGIARALEKDIDAAAEAGVDIIEVSAPTSKLQRTKLLGLNFEELRGQVIKMVEYAQETGCEVHFGAMDGFRTDIEELNTLIDEVDVPYFGIADTVGARTPDEVANILGELNCDLSGISVHFHNDLGVATANALAATQAGVGKVDTTLAGIGERVGNTPFEELVAIISLHDELIATEITEPNLIPLIQEILDILNEEVSPNKPLLGSTAFEHESGMHTAALLDDPATFEAFPPQRFGAYRRLLFGPSSGRGAARRLLERVQVEPSQDNVVTLLERLHSLDRHIPLEEALRLTANEFVREEST